MNYIFYTDQAFALTEFFSREECEAERQRAEAMGFSEATIATGLETRVARDVRNNDRVIFDDPALARRCWERCRHYLPAYPGGWQPVGLNERFRCYRYEPGQVFRWHRDGSFERFAQERSLMTVLIYLNDQYTGGDTAFSDFSVRPGLGLALFFDHNCMHEGSEVRSGQKFVLRSDVMYRRSDAKPVSDG